MLIRSMVMGVLMLSSAGLASAQSSSRTGLTMGFPGAVGVVFETSDRLAFRPEVSVSKNASTTTIAGTTITSSGWGGGAALSVMVYGKDVDRVRTYFSPRFAWARTSATTSSTTTSAGNAYTFTGSFGADCAVTKRVSIFGELGFGYGWSEVTIAASPAGKTTAKTAGIRSALGLTWYFK